MTNTPVDKEEAEAHSLAERAGFVWYDTEAAARMMARHAATEILALSSALTARDELLRDLGAAMQDFSVDNDRPAFVFEHWRDRIREVLK